MTAPIDDQCIARQPREQAVRCWCGRGNIWSLSGLCPRHEISDATPTASEAGPSNPAGRHDHPHPVVSAPSSQAPARLGDERDPTARPSGQHGSAAVLANSSTASPAVDTGVADAPVAAHDHTRPRTTGSSTGTAPRRGVGGTPALCP